MHQKLGKKKKEKWNVAWRETLDNQLREYIILNQNHLAIWRPSLYALSDGREKQRYLREEVVRSLMKESKELPIESNV